MAERDTFEIEPERYELFEGRAGTGSGTGLLARYGDLFPTLSPFTRRDFIKVGALGMGGSLISLEAASYTGTGNLVAKVLSDENSRKAVEEILTAAKDEARRILESNGQVLHALRDALVDREELVGDEILDVIAVAERQIVDLR